MNKARFEKLFDLMEKNSAGQILVSSPSYIYYLTGLWPECGERMVVLSIGLNRSVKLIINRLFPVEPIEGVQLVYFDDSEPAVEVLCKNLDNTRTGIDKNWPSRFLIELMNKKPEMSFFNSTFMLDSLRIVKDKQEIELMKTASIINDSVMEKVIELVPELLSEHHLAKAVKNLFETQKSRFSFEPIVAYGKNGACPHHEPDNSILKINEGVILDIGGMYKKYCSDMTRTVFYGKAPAEFKKVYDIVLTANLKAISFIKPGVKFCEIDFQAREHISEKGFGQYFTHRTGHNIGLDVHEYADVGPSNELTVQPGMIFSIEPGIYLPDKLGVRIEDLVLVTENGAEVLNRYDKNLIEL